MFSTKFEKRSTPNRCRWLGGVSYEAKQDPHGDHVLANSGKCALQTQIICLLHPNVSFRLFEALFAPECVQNCEDHYIPSRYVGFHSYITSLSHSKTSTILSPLVGLHTYLSDSNRSYVFTVRRGTISAPPGPCQQAPDPLHTNPSVNSVRWGRWSSWESCTCIVVTNWLCHGGQYTGQHPKHASGTHRWGPPLTCIEKDMWLTWMNASITLSLYERHQVKLKKVRYRAPSVRTITKMHFQGFFTHKGRFWKHFIFKTPVTVFGRTTATKKKYRILY